MQVEIVQDDARDHTGEFIARVLAKFDLVNFSEFLAIFDLVKSYRTGPDRYR